MKSCEALKFCDTRPKQRAGEPCGDLAEYEFEGHAVCWTHYQACTVGPRALGTKVSRPYFKGEKNFFGAINPVEFAKK